MIDSCDDYEKALKVRNFMRKNLKKLRKQDDQHSEMNLISEYLALANNLVKSFSPTEEEPAASIDPITEVETEITDDNPIEAIV